MNVLITGGLGYIGVPLTIYLSQFHNVTILDSAFVYLQKMDYINRNAIISPKYANASLKDLDRLYGLFSNKQIDYIIHCASNKSISESTRDPFKYYNNNLQSFLNLISLAKRVNCKSIINCSSGSIYQSSIEPVNENSKINPINPYSKIKLLEENILQDIYNSDSSWNITNLRLFNPINPIFYKLFGPYSDLFGTIITNFKNNTPIQLYGNTIRDYFHINDLIKIFELIMNKFTISGYRTYNVGSGIGTAILDVVKLFQKYTNIEYEQIESNFYDQSAHIADISKIENELNWYPSIFIEDIVKECYNNTK